MNFHQYYPVDAVNGPGTRCTLFISGCEHQCKGCYNATTWPINSGQPFTERHLRRLIDDLNDSQIPRQGLSLSGGDPLHPANVPAINQLLQRVKQEAPHADVWCWTGYTAEQLSTEQRALLARVDVLIDGRYEQMLHSANLPWRGSTNQRVWRISPAGFTQYS